MGEKDFLNEKLLIDELKKGSQDAFSYLFKAHHSELCNYMTAITGDATKAEDFAQQTFVRIWDKRTKLSVEENNLKKYIFRIAYHLFIDSKRKKKKEFELLESLREHAYQEILDTDSSLFEERLKKVEAEIENLPEQCRKVFIMSKKEGLKYREISEKLHISIKTVEVHMAKALKRLRTQLTIFF